LLVSNGLKVLRNSIEKIHKITPKDQELIILSIIQSSNNSVKMNDLKDILLKQQEFDTAFLDLKAQGYIIENLEKQSIFSKFLSSIGMPLQTKNTIQLTEKGKNLLKK